MTSSAAAHLPFGKTCSEILFVTKRSMSLTQNNTVLGPVVSDILSEFRNQSLCSEVDLRVRLLLEVRRRAWDELNPAADEDAGDAMDLLPPVALLCISLIAAAFGARLFRPVAALVAAIFAFYVVYGFGRSLGSGVACETLLGVASTAALVAALATGCLIKAALFLLGAGATAAVVHLSFSMFPELHTMGDQPTLAERSFAYWGLMALAVIGGGLIVRWNAVPILEVLTASIGGAGTAYALHAIALVANGADGAPDRRIFFGCGIVAAVLGVTVQRRHRLRGGGVCKKTDSNR